MIDADDEVIFPKLNHFWLDSGLLGLYELLNAGNGRTDVTWSLDEQALQIRGEAEAIEGALRGAYDALIERYYSRSTERQRANKQSHNFYYDSKRDAFEHFPKRKATGIVRLVYDKAPRSTGTTVKWARKEKRDISVDGKTIKRNRGVLPPSHAHLQKRMDAFLDTLGLDVTTSGLLIDGPNEVRPNVIIAVRDRQRRSTSAGMCYLCGREARTFDSANQTIFPFITGSSGVLSFNPSAGQPEKICWRCAFVGKFGAVNGFYLASGTDLFAFFPYSASLVKMHEVYGDLQEMKYDDPNLYKNFQHPLGVGKYADGFFQRPFEVAFAFLYTLYRRLLVYEHAAVEGGGSQSGATDHGEGNAPLFDWDKMLQMTLAKAPLEFMILHAERKGATFLGKLLWPFRDSIYFFRLLYALDEARVDVKEVMRELIDFKQKNETRTLARDRICERILKKKTVLPLVEVHCYHADASYIDPLVRFVLNYEQCIRQEDDNVSITTEEQEAAVTLGKRIGAKIGEAARTKGPGAGKGDLYGLRKVRKKADFLAELNRLQFRYDLVVPPDVYGGKLTDSNFAEFKGFCMLAALNTFNAASARPRAGAEGAKGGS